MPRVFWWLWGGALISSLATFVFPFLALYLTSRGFDAQRTGLIVSMMGVGSICAGPLAGTVADRFGRKPAVLGSLCGAAAAAVYLGFVHDPLYVAPGVLLFGVCALMGYPAINATVADILPAENVQKAYGYLYWANNLGVGFSAIVGGMLASRSWLGLFLADAATTLLFAVIVARRIPETRPAPHPDAATRGWNTLLSDWRFVSFLVVQLGYMLVFWQFQFAVPIAMGRDGLGAEAYGRVLAANCVFILVGQPLATRVLARFDEGLVLAAATLFLGAGYGAYALCSTTPQYFAATLLWTVGEFCGLPPASALIAKLAPEDLRGRYQGAFGMCMSVAMTAAPILAGAIIDRRGVRALWLACFALCAATAAAHVALSYFRARGKASLPA